MRTRSSLKKVALASLAVLVLAGCNEMEEDSAKVLELERRIATLEQMADDAKLPIPTDASPEKDYDKWYREHVIDLRADDGQLRVQTGIYSAAGEKGLPFSGLFDNSANLRLLYRLAGSNESPVLIFKDKSGSDRVVLGLGLNGKEEPFLAIIHEDGKKEMIFGEY